MAYASHRAVKMRPGLQPHTVQCRECNPRVPENPGNPPVFKPVKPGLCAVKNPGFTGLI